jgi:hypothetical protein
MSSIEKTITVKTEFFDNFIWKKLPLEHDYITIVFCISKFKNTEQSPNEFLENIENENIKKSIKYILNIMPCQCFVNIGSYNEFKNYINDNDLVSITNKLNEKNSEIENLSENELLKLKEKIKKVENKKTCIFTYNTIPDIDMEKNVNINEKFYDKTLKNVLDMSINNNFNESHKICIGEINNIPKNIISVADYIFFENMDIINEYFQTFNYNIRIQTSNTQLYLIDKCNYEYYQLFSFTKHLKS